MPPSPLHVPIITRFPGFSFRRALQRETVGREPAAARIGLRPPRDPHVERVPCDGEDGSMLLAPRAALAGEAVVRAGVDPAAAARHLPDHLAPRVRADGEA